MATCLYTSYRRLQVFNPVDIGRVGETAPRHYKFVGVCFNASNDRNGVHHLLFNIISVGPKMEEGNTFSLISVPCGYLQ